MKTLNPIKLIVLITICISYPPCGVSAQTVSWTSSDETIATMDANGTVTPANAGTVTITATLEQNGKTVTSSKTVEVTLTLPPITINGVKWAQGNVTFDPSSCTGGVCTRLAISSDPYERGLIFQWYGGTSGGVVIGYPKGGTTTTGSSGNAWNVTPDVNDTSTWRYVQPGATFPSSYPVSGGIYNGYGTMKGEWTANNPCTLIGGDWRLPTKAEGESIFRNIAWTKKTSNGVYFENTATGLIFPLAGWRDDSSSGLMINQAVQGYTWLSTDSTTSRAYGLRQEYSSSLDVSAHSKMDGFPVRCVKD